MSWAVRTEPAQIAFSCRSLDWNVPVAARAVAEATRMTTMPAAIAVRGRNVAVRMTES